MPFSDKLLIQLQLRRIQPFADADFRSVFRAFFRLKNIGKGALLIVPAQRKHAAEARAESMNTAAAGSVQERRTPYTAEGEASFYAEFAERLDRARVLID